MSKQWWETPKKRKANEIKRLQELLVRHGNRVDMLKDAKLNALYGLTEAAIEKDRKKVYVLIKKADTSLLKEAAEELNRREMEWTR